MRGRTGSSIGPGGVSASSSASATGGSGGGGRSHRHKRRPGHRRNTQHNVGATVEPICDMQKVVNGVVSVDPDKWTKLVKQEPIDLYYQVEEEPFASGLFATVRKCRHRTSGIEFAAKYATKMRYGQDCTTEILHEIALMSLCTTNPRIIHLVDVFDSPTHMILVMEYAPGGDLQTLMDDDMVPYERDAVKFVRQVLEGLLFLHEHNIAHLDIKLQNVLLLGTFPDCDVKLCDLEISRFIFAGQEVRELLGTPDYVSPEILHYEPIALSADIWSVGVMAYVLLTGFTPFGGDTDQETFHNICHGQLDFPDELFEDVSPQAEDFIRKTLTREPCQRPTVRECLKHPWLTSWKNVASHQRETISSEGQRKTTAMNGATTCPRSAAAASINGHGHGHHYGPSSAAARSLQRAMSKSREVLYERVAASNLRKSTSKSRERLCEMKLSMSRSRDHLCHLQPAQSRLRLAQSLRNLSKSHEVLSLQIDPSSGDASASSLGGGSGNGSLYHIVPLAQSLECFTIPPMDGPDLSALPQLVPPQVGDTCTQPMFALSSAFSESTETLCEAEVQEPQVRDPPDEVVTGVTTLAEPPPPKAPALAPISIPAVESFDTEVTPSNSRAVTPTRASLPPLFIPTLPEGKSGRGSEQAATAPVQMATKESPAAVSPWRLNLPAETPKSPVAPPTPPTPPTPTPSPTPQVKKAERAVEAEAKSDGNSFQAFGIRMNRIQPPPPLKLSTDALSPSAIQKSPQWPSSQKSPQSLSSPTQAVRKPPSSPSSGTSTTSSTSSLPSKDAPPSPAAASSAPKATPATAQKPVLTPIESRLSEAETHRIDTTVLTEDDRIILPSLLNRRRASWAYGMRQEDVAVAMTVNVGVATVVTNSSNVNIVGRRKKEEEPKLSVAELISNFNRQLPQKADASAAEPAKAPAKKTSGAAAESAPAAASAEPSPTTPPAGTKTDDSVPKTNSEKDKVPFKPSSTALQLFQKPGPLVPVAQAFPASASTNPALMRRRNSCDRVSPTEAGSRSRPHHFLWDIRALPRLPEDSVSSPKDEDTEAPNESSDKESGQDVVDSATKPVEEASARPVEAEKTEEVASAVDEKTPAELAADFPRSGSVSSDTGCSSGSSDLSDRLSDEGADQSHRTREHASPSEGETGLAPAPNWRGRPRSFSVQSDISFLAQPWNRVCTGAVARAFEKFQMKNDNEPTAGNSSGTSAPSGPSAPSAPTSNNGSSGSNGNNPALRNRRQSTPGFKPLV